VKIKYLPTFFLLTDSSWHDKSNGHASTMGQMGQHGPNKDMTCRAWAEPSARGPARHGTARSIIRVVPSLPLGHGHDANGLWAVLVRSDLPD
jgi:hypothetical protein